MGGRRIQEATPGGHWKIMTILGAMSLNGMVATMTIEEPTDTDIFLGVPRTYGVPGTEGRRRSGDG